jgi:uncharacterized membrane protein
MAIPSAEISAGERLLAGLSQLLGWWGALPVLLINWGRSKFVSYQAVQSILFSLAVFLAQAAVVVCLLAMLISGLATGSAPEAPASDAADPSGPGIVVAALSLLGLGSALPVLTALSVLSVIIRIFAALVCLSGRVFRYPLLNRLAGRYPPK